jgi:hypothetical protein
LSLAQRTKRLWVSDQAQTFVPSVQLAQMSISLLLRRIDFRNS